jgi:hypothetical protein
MMSRSLSIKILGTKKAQRYCIRRLVVSVLQQLSGPEPSFSASILEIKSSPEILTYTQVIAAPSLVIEENLVCCGRIPQREEVASWLSAALVSAPAPQEGQP